MGCFVSCFRTNDQERPRIQCSHFDSHCGQKGLKEECVGNNEFGSVSLNESKEEVLGNPCALNVQLKQETKHFKPSSPIQENPVENFQSTNRIALQELNGSNECPESAHTLSSEKVQLAVQCESENSPNQTKLSTPSLEKERSTSSQKTPGTASTEEIRDCKLDLTLVKNGTRVPVSDPNSPCPTPMILNGEMQTPATIYPLYKGTTINAKQVYATLKLTDQVKISNDSESVKLKKENEVPQECSTKKCIEDTPKVVVPDTSQCLNGIPNTTTKYKEDQRVKWHATPFEERLERILSDEEMPPTRKIVPGRLIQLEE